MPRRLAWLAVSALALLGGLFFHGLALDAAPYEQARLWRAVRMASLGGAGLGALASALLWLRTPWQRLLLVPLALGVWRIAYFPLMVFSGHVVSISEWLHAFLGLPIWIYALFLPVIAGLHCAVCFVAAQLLRPIHPLVPLALAPAFAVAIAVSFSKPEDLAWSPDRFVSLAEPVPAPVAPGRNPYFPKLFGPGYRAHQRVMLVAAGLTYETIPPSPWGRTVKSVLEVLFDENPHGSTADRVHEHYLAYASAHPLIGCTSFEACAVEVRPAPLAANAGP
jgi:hypothetical protein